jgi:YVTN family beta-propeller protein
VEFGILGPVVARRDGEQLPLGGPKPRALLAVLLLHANQPVSRDALIEALWGEQAPPTASHTLDNYVSRLRAVIGRDRLLTRPPGYGIVVEEGELDLDRFQRLADEGRRELAHGAPSAAAEAFRGAVALWRGPALSDLFYEAALGAESARLEELRLAVLEDAIDADLELGESAKLVPELEGLVREHPLRERLVRQLMLALYRSGRQAAALDTYRSTRRRLAEDLGLEPGPQLQQLERLILEHDPSLELDLSKSQRVKWAGRQPRRRTWFFAAAAVVVAGAVSAGVVLATGSTRSPSGLAPTSQLILLRGRDGRITNAIAQSSAPSAIADAGTSLWATAPEENAVFRVEPSGRVTDRVPLLVEPGEIAVGGGSVWVTATVGDTITRIDESTDEVTQTLQLGAQPGGMCFCGGRLWVTDPADQALLEVDANSGGVKRSITLSGSRPSSVVAGAGQLWVASYDTGTVVEVDPDSGTATNVVHVGQGPSSPVFGDRSVWVANRLDGTVSQIDAQAASVTRTIPTGSSPVALAFANGSLWVADESTSTVQRIDPKTGTLGGATDVRGDPISLAVAARGVWVGTRPAGGHRGGMLVLLDTRRFQSIDPQVDYEAPPPAFLGLVNDTLVAYDHTGGAAGSQLVPDLALRLPQISDGGRTYTFVLRPGLHYSDGRQLRATDFARAMTRLFKVGSPSTPFFSILVGAPACVARPTTCRLPRGVTTDDAARTIVFHLSAPDPDFVFKLALGQVVPIPPGTPMHEVRTQPIVGTGPYVFAQVGAKQFTFVRNLRFHEWSAAAQPDGNPDRIVWRFGLTADQEIRQVAAGRADWTGDFPADLSAVLRRYAAEVHNNPFPTAYFAQVDTRRPPFDDVGVRRALNYAIDRAEVVRLSGGRAINTALCQVIPPGLPGYRPYCPYTADPRPDGRWTAPNLALAKALVARSGTRGEPVTVWSVSDTGSAEPAATYISGVLKRLGYRAHTRVVTASEMSRMAPGTVARMQLHPVIFGPDYPSASEIYSLFFACGGQFTHHYLCDPRLDRDARRAEALRLSDPARSAAQWARIDRILVDRADWVPLTTQRILDFVSTRLGNYESSPVYHFLPAQAWVR